MLPHGLTQLTQKTITNKPGFLLEEVATAFIHHNEWTFINVFNLTELEEEINVIEDYYDNLESQLKAGPTFPFVYQHVGRRKSLVLDARKLLNDIYKLIGLPNARPKRGVFDFVGQISKTLFGTLSSEDADYYNKEIDKLYQTNEQFSNLISNQTTIIKSLVYDNVGLRDTISQIGKKQAKDFQIITNEIQALNVADYVILDLLDLYRAEETLDDVLRELQSAIETAYQGRISHTFLNDEVITQICESMPRFQTFGLSDLATLLQISQVNIYTTNGRFIYEIKVPELESNPFEIIKITSIPEIDEHGYAYYWQSPADYVIRNKRDNSIMLTSETEISKCMVLRENKICRRKASSRQISASDGCLYNVFNPSAMTDCKCERKLTPLSGIHFIPLYNKNRMISYNDKATTVSVLYGKNQHENVELQGVKLLTLSPDTTVISDNEVIYSSDSTERTLTFMDKIQILPYNIKSFKEELNTFLKYNDSIIEEIKLPESKIDQKTTLNTLNEINAKAKLLESHKRTLTYEEKTNNWIKYLFIGLGILGLGYILHLFGVIEFVKGLLTTMNLCCGNKICINLFSKNKYEVREANPTNLRYDVAEPEAVVFDKRETNDPNEVMVTMPQINQRPKRSLTREKKYRTLDLGGRSYSPERD